MDNWRKGDHNYERTQNHDSQKANIFSCFIYIIKTGSFATDNLTDKKGKCVIKIIVFREQKMKKLKLIKNEKYTMGENILPDEM